ncbi:bifunctional hydroxymethylpyrimidine kinase/phosphomethylpyrimidine kinase [Bacillus sp. N1-1]|jgi:hydroxymethylpyrimidine/phosphomethylpyrimidine kinase|uniref:bifunctional hydroxymethylpyrimidine kinase/phosphomethylpyrimidine kinase n=1 Tax=Bacillus sp. N1-1 TaxID=2682541 RepID=UPI00131994C3|nr:bifunctional hydroxymethylpyrimidine kinase/phosphomethylpyrimidine kinase [Bacillus sp. N1-1]QHA92559.1 bifunctional hydroxymethylpyrimidine kinase/phosphomethylpyrimidine kinase [Bacillus sp. N1-1]
MYKALTIAGSDSGGGAGIQADLKTFQERNVFGMSAITALTAQNTLGVHHVFPQTVEAVQSQLDAVLSDIGADAVKTGMLFSSEIILAVSKKIKEYKVPNLVIDPVMIAKGGASLLQKDAILAMKEHLFPLGAVITPNLPEAASLLNCGPITSIKEMEEAAKSLHESGADAVLVKGGHMTGEASIDVLYVNECFYHYESKRIETKHTHGTGCTFSACIAAELARGRPIPEAVAIAKEYITAAITHGLPIGKGIGPTNHAAYRQTQTSIMKS